MSPSLTLLGVGNMGAALAHAFLKAGISVTAWNRTADHPLVKSVMAAGARYEPDIAEALRQNNVVIICFLDYAAIYKLLEPVEGSDALKGKTIINLTNGTPKQARELDPWLRARGVSKYLDGAVMITPQLVGTEHSYLVLSGEDEEVFADVSKRYIEPAGRCMYRGPEVGAASLFDVAALAPMYGMFTGLFISIGLLSRQKLPVPEGSIREQDRERPKIAELVQQTIVPLMTAMAPYLGLITQSWDAGTWDENVGNTVGMQLEGLNNIIQACEDEKVDQSGLVAIRSLFERIVRDYGGQDGIAVGGRYMLK